jgi:hypothetical protein
MRMRGVGLFGRVGTMVVLLVALTAAVSTRAYPADQTQPEGPQAQSGNAQGSVARTMGTVESISGNSINLKAQNGATVAVTVPDTARVLRVEPGEKDLKNAVPIQLTDILVGDRILVFGRASEDTKSVTAATVIAMKKADIDAKQQQEREDWQKRGVGGLVSAVDPAAGTVTISVASFSGTKPLVIHTTNDTIFRRYAPDSVRFDDAKPSKLNEIKPGDQLRARGAKSADGSSLAAEEVVTGSFRNISGTILAVNAAADTLTVTDLATKQPVTVKITSASEVRKLPVMIAQMMAMRMKGPAAGAGGPGQAPGQGPGGARNGGGPGQANGQSASQQAAVGQERQGGPGAGGNGRRGNGTPDFQSMISRIPPASLSDFQKGDAVMIVSTEGSDSGAVTAITVLGGVEPILAASPNGGQQMTLSPWSLGGGEGGDQGAGGDAGGGVQ